MRPSISRQLAQLAGLRTAGRVFVGVVAALSAIVLGLLAAERRGASAEGAAAG